MEVNAMPAIQTAGARTSRRGGGTNRRPKGRNCLVEDTVVGSHDEGGTQSAQLQTFMRSYCCVRDTTLEVSIYLHSGKLTSLKLNNFYKTYIRIFQVSFAVKWYYPGKNG